MTSLPLKYAQPQVCQLSSILEETQAIAPLKLELLELEMQDTFVLFSPAYAPV